MRVVEIDVPDPGPNEVRLKQRAAGLNFIDLYYRSGLYQAPLPHGLGVEGAGEVEALGPGVKGLKQGDRVAYPMGPLGAYSGAYVVSADRVVKLPASIGFEQAAAMMLKGLTVQYLFRQTYRLQGYETILFHAAAGGVGLIACQWARAIGVTMIGTVGSDEKAEIARAHGCTHVINYKRENFVERVKEITEGRGVPVVYDSVGKDTFMGSLDCLQKRGTLVSNGTSSGPVVFDVTLLAAKGSLWITRPAMMDYALPRPNMLKMADELFDLVLQGKIVSEPGQTFALADAAEAHRALESRSTIGATVLLP